MKEIAKKLIDDFDIKVHNQRLFSSLMINPSLRSGETYMDGWWDCEKLDELFEAVSAAKITEIKHPSETVTRFLNSVFNMQSRLRSKKVIDLHYNLGNDLYEAMLGPSMAYTCAYWKTAKTLDQAQLDKYDLICRKADLKKGERILDLGCGFGGFSKFAAEKYGCEVVGVNISTEQVRYGRQICKDLPVTFCLTDYRNDKIYNPNREPFDKVISIGLCEHVGYKNYRSLMELVARNLKSDGLFLLHTIGSNQSRKFTDAWLHKYIFPNSLLPSIAQLSRASEGVFVMEDWHNFGADYDKTLMAWFANFDRHWPKLKANYGDRFYRMWKYYLLSCAGLFRSRSIQLWQVVFSKNGIPGGYTTIR